MKHPVVSPCFVTGKETENLDHISDLILAQEYYYRDTVIVAEDLLGKLLLHKVDETWCGGYIVETEAYLGPADPASHAYRGPSPRASVMYGPPGHAYVYFIYGMYFCMNIVAYDPVEQQAGAVLIRALEPALDIPGMQERRKKTKLAELTSGPGKICQALGISQSETGKSLWDSDLVLADANVSRDFSIVRTTRIGISRAVEYPYRFYVSDCPHVSSFR